MPSIAASLGVNHFFFETFFFEVYLSHNLLHRLCKSQNTHFPFAFCECRNGCQTSIPMDVTEYFLPPGRHLLDACGDSGFDTSVDGLAVLFSQRAEGATDAGFQGRVKKVGKGGWVLGGTVAGKLDIQGYIYIISFCRVYFDCFKKV